MQSHRNTYLEVYLNNLSYNYDFFKNKSSKAVFSVVKANAYGLGAVEVSKHLVKLGTSYLGVATLDEAIELRESKIKTPILVMGYTPVDSAKIAVDNDITLTVISEDWAKELSLTNVNNIKLHIKLNSSMNRLGHNSLEEIKSTLELLKARHQIEGIFTHYCCQDSLIVNKDFNNFKSIVDTLDFDFKWVHASNSYNAINFDEDFTNAVRIGIGLYGGLLEYGLKHVSSLYSEVALIRSLNIGDKISYDGLYKADKETRAAILTIGYADGISRLDKDNKVYINKKYYNIIGSICMDQMMVEVDDNVSLYDKVELFGQHINILDIAKSRNTIDYEVLTSISNRVHKVYKQD